MSVPSQSILHGMLNGCAKGYMQIISKTNLISPSALTIQPSAQRTQFSNVDSRLSNPRYASIRAMWFRFDGPLVSTERSSAPCPSMCSNVVVDIIPRQTRWTANYAFSERICNDGLKENSLACSYQLAYSSVWCEFRR